MPTFQAALIPQCKHLYLQPVPKEKSNALFEPFDTSCRTAVCKQSAPSPEFSAESEGINEDTILFASGPWRHSLLYAVNTNGAKLRKVADIDSTNPWYGSFLSPDRNRVAFFSTDGYLSVLRIDTGELKRLIEAPQDDSEGYVAWAPDSTKIVYTSNRDLYVVNSDGSGDRKLAEHNSGEYVNRGIIEDQIRHPMWSADGNYILFDDFRAPSFYTDGTSHPDIRLIYAVDEATGEVKSLAGGRLGHQTSDRTKVLIETELWVWSVMDIGTSIQKERHEFFPNHGILAEPKLPEKLTDCKWSPDGRVIAGIAHYRGEQGWRYELWMLDAITGERIPSAAEIQDVSQFIWSSDGRHIAYVAGYVSRDEIHITRHDLSHSFLVYQGKQRIRLIAWLSQK